MNVEKDKSLLYYRFYLPDKAIMDDKLIFCNDPEEFQQFLDDDEEDCEDKLILNSIYFKRYLNKRRGALAEYLGIEENQLAQFIHSKMKAHINEDGNSEIKLGTEGLIETFTKNIISDNNGGAFWYNQMTGTYKDNNKDAFNYVPDVNRLIENYYKSYVITRFFEEMKKHLGFTKLTLSRECVPPSIENDYQMILCMYEMDVFYKMFSMMQKQYYHDFSWEKITKQDITKRFEKIVSDQQRIINEKENTISILADKNEALSLQILSDNSKQTAPLVVENNKLLKKIEDKDLVIGDLKKQIQSQEEFILELSKTDDDIIKDSDTYDLSILQSKRYLFVGHISAVLPELRHKFSNSLFMENETYNTSGVNVDAVVMLVRWMSHGMFYKIKSSLPDAKIIMCNTKNIDTILQKIYNEI